MAESATPEQKVIVVDFGAQYGQLIARRVRDLHVYSEIVPCDITAEEVRAIAPAAIILSGGPASVYAEDAPSIDPEILALGIPVLGFCYGQQAMAVALGGEVGHTEKGEYGPAVITRAGESALFDGTPGEQTVWMSHRDAVSRVPEGFSVTSRTEVCPVASMEYPERRLFATQFHPEVRHTEFGQTMLRNFLFGVCELEPDWTMDSIIDDSVEVIRAEVGDDRVILGLSGGVDSSVVAALCARAIGKQLTCVFVNHGLLRKGEPEEVEEVFTKQFDVDFIHVHAEERYLELLRGVTDPEEKRRIIGTQFWKEFFAVAEDLAQDGRPVKYLAQGTIYPDIIESGARKTGGKASTIKSHHNLIPFPEGVHFDLIEPLDHFFKDEVRALGTALGLPDYIVHRQPFPGPGLAIRIIGTVTRDKLAILKEADAILTAMLRGGTVTAIADRCALPDFRVVLTKRQTALRQKLLDSYRKSGREVPFVDDIYVSFPTNERDDCKKVLENLVSCGELVMLTPQLFYHKDVYEEVCALSRDFFEGHPAFTLAEYRDLLGTSRKYALAILEFFDKTKVTKMVGDHREVIGSL